MNSSADTRTIDDGTALTARQALQSLSTPFLAAGDTLELQLSLLWEKLLRVRPIGMRDNFFELGGDSQLADRLFAEISALTGRTLVPSDFLNKPTVEHLARMIRQTRWSPSWSSLVSIKAGGSRLPLFFVHSPGGYVVIYYYLARHLGTDQPVYGLQSAGVAPHGTPHFNFEEMAAHYIREMRSLQPVGPYLLSGFCSGGILALEMAQQLRAQGCRVALLALMDAYPRHEVAAAGAASAGRISRIRKKLGYHFGRFMQRDIRGKRAYLRERLKNVGVRVKIGFWIRVHDHYLRKGRPLPRLFQDVFMINLRAGWQYEPQPYPHRITLLASDAIVKEFAIDPEKVWRPFAAGGLELYRIEGDHDNLLTEPNAGHVAMILRNCLDKVAASELGKRQQ